MWAALQTFVRLTMNRPLTGDQHLSEAPYAVVQVAPQHVATTTVTTVSSNYHRPASGAVLAGNAQAHGSNWTVRVPGGAAQCCLCGEQGWTFGVCWPDGCCNGGCCGNTGCNGCICRNFCATPCMYARAVSMANGSNCCCCCLANTMCCLPFVGCCLCCERGKLRSNYGIHGGCGACQDCCCCIYCFPCAMCQIIQEVNYREDVRIGCCGHPDGTAALACDCHTGEMAKQQFRKQQFTSVSLTSVEMSR